MPDPVDVALITVVSYPVCSITVVPDPVDVALITVVYNPVCVALMLCLTLSV